MRLNRIDDEEVSNEGDDDMIGPEAKRHKFNAKLLNSTEAQLVLRLSTWPERQQMAASYKLYGNKQKSIYPVQAHELVHQGVQASLGHLQQCIER